MQDARRDQSDDAAGAVAHGRDHPDRRAQRAGVDLRERLTAQRGVDGADVLPADLRGIGVGEPGSIGRHDRDERDGGVLADGFGDWLQSLSGSSGLDRRGRRRGICQRSGDAEHLLTCGVVTIAGGVEQRQRAAGHHHHRDHQDL